VCGEHAGAQLKQIAGCRYRAALAAEFSPWMTPRHPLGHSPSAAMKRQERHIPVLLERHSGATCTPSQLTFVHAQFGSIRKAPILRVIIHGNLRVPRAHPFRAAFVRDLPGQCDPHRQAEQPAALLRRGFSRLSAAYCRDCSTSPPYPEESTIAKRAPEESTLPAIIAEKEINENAPTPPGSLATLVGPSSRGHPSPIMANPTAA